MPPDQPDIETIRCRLCGRIIRRGIPLDRHDGKPWEACEDRPMVQGEDRNLAEAVRLSDECTNYRKQAANYWGGRTPAK